MKKRILLFISIIILAGGGILLYRSFHDRGKNMSWKTSSVEKGDVIVGVTATGSLNALVTVAVGAQVNGVVAKLYADFNDKVKKGQVIALLDTTILAAARDDAEAALDKTINQLKQSTQEYERNKVLYEQNVISKADYEVVYTNYITAQSALRSAKAQLNRSNINLQYATIRAPISGVVISRNVDVGQTVISSFNTPVLYSIANDLEKMELVANVDEADIGQVKVGQDVSFSVDAYPEQQFSGKVKQIRLQPIIVQNVVNYAVIINVPNPDLKLLPGLTANISIKVNEDTNVCKVPVSAFAFKVPKEYQKFVPTSMQNIKISGSANAEGLIWTKKGDSLVPIMVHKGLSDGSFVSVQGNVKEGQEIITGILNGSTEETNQPQNPFMPRFPTRGTKK